MTDAGMSGDYDSVIGMDKEEPLNRFLRKLPVERFKPASRARHSVRRGGGDG